MPFFLRAVKLASNVIGRQVDAVEHECELLDEFDAHRGATVVVSRAWGRRRNDDELLLPRMLPGTKSGSTAFFCDVFVYVTRNDA